MSDNINILYSKDGRKGYFVGDKEILEYTLHIPFSIDFHGATYIRKIKLTEAIKVSLISNLVIKSK